MLTITCSPRFNQEKKYIIKVILGDFLGLDYKLSVDADIANYVIKLPNGAKLEFEETNIWKRKNYLNKRNVPTFVEYASNSYTVEKNIPVILGTTRIKEEVDYIVCGIDIFASSFFMLSRWEEFVLPKKDEHNRFPANASLAYKHNFLQRPIVNEYTEMLWNMLLHLGINQERKERTYSLTLTHDVDDPFYWKDNSISKLIEEVLRGIKHRSAQRAMSRIKSKVKLTNDPFYKFDEILDISEIHNLKSHFFFMAGGRTKYDNRYSLNDKRIKMLLAEIERRGHHIGFHPSYDAYKESEIYQKELGYLQSHTKKQITTGREHYLRFEVPKTWQIWEQNKMHWDSTMAYADNVGFRCGTCYTFPVFDILQRKECKLLEKPLTAMEATLYNYMGLSFAEVCATLQNLKQNVQKYKGEFVFLWHNSFFHRKDFGSRLEEYKKIIEIIKP